MYIPRAVTMALVVVHHLLALPKPARRGRVPEQSRCCDSNTHSGAEVGNKGWSVSPWQPWNIPCLSCSPSRTAPLLPKFWKQFPNILETPVVASVVYGQDGNQPMTKANHLVTLHTTVLSEASWALLSSPSLWGTSQSLGILKFAIL